MTDHAKYTMKSDFSFPLLPLRNGVLFPGTFITLSVGRERSMALIKELSANDTLGIAIQRDPEHESPTKDDLHELGTWARVHRVMRAAGHYRVVVEGLHRFRLDDVVEMEPYWIAKGTPLLETEVTETHRVLAEGLGESIQALIAETDGLSGLSKSLPEEPGALADVVASGLGLPIEQELEIFQLLDVEERLKKVAGMIGEIKTRFDVKRSIDEEMQRNLSENQREAILRERMRAIKKELGDEEDGELKKLLLRLEEAELPEEIQKTADREIKRLASMNKQQAEYNVIWNYLEWIADLPWSKRAEVNDDLFRVSTQLDSDHEGLKEVKTRILEYMAVAKRSGRNRGTLLCLYGPPGVGKTSLAQSIADATERPLVRLALGGMRDESEIRGHRRTYVGARPGRLVTSLKKAGVKNPVILLDEIDKVGQGGWNGDPQAALLEVLDPEQNDTFTDRYMELPFDLSEVLFICTANALDTLSAPLRDRLEIIEINGYTTEEKVEIARNHLLRRQYERHQLDENLLKVTDDALRSVIQDYTREAGVRQLNRQIEKICRSATLEIMKQEASDSKLSQIVVGPAELENYLGKVRFFSEVGERLNAPGIATGLAWTPVGGDILFIETTKMPGRGKLEITGKLGEVMQESARAALTYVRSHAGELGVPADFLDNNDLHIHVPAGAVPKDGPSAGVTIFTALSSLFTGRKVRSDTAMTGECSLRGRVLPVGGIKAKVLAAHRAGLTRVILPKRNERDVEDVPTEIRENMEFIFAEDMQEVLAAALEAVAGPVEVDPKSTKRSLSAAA